MQINMYTDGSCMGNPGPAGVGIVLKAGNNQKEFSKYIGKKTNNVAELKAILLGLGRILNPGKHAVTVYTDSKYAQGVLMGNWNARVNLELIAEIKKKMLGFQKVEVKWVKSHSTSKGNNIADNLAKNAVKKAIMKGE